MSNVREQVIDFMGRHAGPNEKPPGSNCTIFGKRYGMDCVPYCAQSVWLAFVENDVEIIKSAFTPTVAQWYADRKRGTTDDSKAVRGCQIFFNFPDSLDRIQHTGLCLRNEPTNRRMLCRESNTSPGDGSQDNGDGTYDRWRPYDHVVYVGFPVYVEELPRFELPKHRTWIGAGDKGADVLRLQRLLNRWMRLRRQVLPDRKLEFDWGKIDEDRRFDAETRKALVAFQKHEGLDTDARAGKHTTARLERKIEKLRDRAVAK